MNVLIVDDNPTNLQLLKLLVAKIDGCLPVAVASAQEALDWCAANEPDLVLTDYMMPDMTGLELVKRMRDDEHLFEVPIVVVTTVDLKEVRQKALELGASDFITKPVDPPELKARVRNLLALRASQKKLKDRAAQDLVIRLSRTAEYRDPETGSHIERMARFARLIAARLEFSEDEQERILLAAPMHDIGKIGIPDHILLKPGKLSSDEFAIMKQHPKLGYEILKGSLSPLVQVAAEIALAHHEKIDGTGYPNGLAGDAIPISARIVAVADVFDALTSRRPYKEPWSFERARDLMMGERGRHFDPRCVDLFFADVDAIEAIRREFAEEPVGEQSLASLLG
ncbi:MAG: response regulator [Alphaproteobacteria bacterium]|nr:response regulator [Alphaproteobacteria bacterium]